MLEEWSPLNMWRKRHSTPCRSLATSSCVGGWRLISWSRSQSKDHHYNSSILVRPRTTSTSLKTTSSQRTSGTNQWWEAFVRVASQHREAAMCARVRGGQCLAEWVHPWPNMPSCWSRRHLLLSRAVIFLLLHNRPTFFFLSKRSKLLSRNVWSSDSVQTGDIFFLPSIQEAEWAEHKPRRCLARPTNRAICQPHIQPRMKALRIHKKHKASTFSSTFITSHRIFHGRLYNCIRCSPTWLVEASTWKWTEAKNSKISHRNTDSSQEKKYICKNAGRTNYH